jgi:putative inorganic carbon (hco3(-)) transporter
MRSSWWSRLGEFAYRWSIPLVVVMLPLEISALVIPFWQLERPIDGQPLSALSFARLAMAVAMAVGVLWSFKHRQLVLPRSRPLLFAGLLFVDYLLSMIVSPAHTRALIEVVRLGSFVLFWVLTMPLLTTEAAIVRVSRTLILTGLVLGLMGIWEFATGRLLWNFALFVISSALRPNATFVDPNNFARFLVIVVFFGILSGEKKPIYRYIGYFTSVICLVTLFFTGSRSAWVTLFIAVAGLIWWSGPSWRLRILLPVGGLVGVIILVILIVPSVGERLSSFQLGVGVLGERIFLIQAGWQMFLDHLALGIGLGGYQIGIQGEYARFVWRGHTTSLSHTSLISVAAELGLVGLAITVGLFVSAYQLFRTAFKQLSTQQRSLALASWLGIVIILAASQGEGRLYEDPYLWLFLMLLTAIARVKWTPDRATVRAGAVEGNL